MYPKSRLDALTDGIYGVAMTLLVLDVAIPAGTQFTNNGALMRGLVGLWPKLIPYLFSYFILVTGWLSAVRIKSRSEAVGRAYSHWWQWQLLLVTLVPFSNVMLGRYFEFPITTALYAANVGLMAVCGYRMMLLLPDPHRDEHYLDRQTSLIVIVASCALTVLLSFAVGNFALYALLLNLATPIVSRRRARRAAA